MKNKLFNPFVYIAGSKALIIGVVVMAISAVLANLCHGHFDKVLDFHKTAETAIPLYISLGEQAIILLCLTLVFYTGGRLFSSSAIRLIDVAGTMALARWPMLAVAICGFGLPGISMNGKIDVEQIQALITPVFMVATFISIVFTVWMVALTYNAFSVSCNIKGSKASMVFIAGILLAEILSYLLSHQLYRLY